MIGRDSRRMIEIIIRRYPTNKKEYERYIEEIMASSSAPATGMIMSQDYVKPQSVTEAKAIKLSSSKKMARLKREIEAVELVYNSLRVEEQEIIEKRFWMGRGKNVSYGKIIDVAYSERQMKRIVSKTILQVGKYLGEV